MLVRLHYMPAVAQNSKPKLVCVFSIYLSSEVVAPLLPHFKAIKAFKIATLQPSKQVDLRILAHTKRNVVKQIEI